MDILHFDFVKLYLPRPPPRSSVATVSVALHLHQPWLLFRIFVKLIEENADLTVVLRRFLTLVRISALFYLVLFWGEEALAFILLWIAFSAPFACLSDLSVLWGLTWSVLVFLWFSPKGHLSFSVVRGATASLNIVCFPPVYCLGSGSSRVCVAKPRFKLVGVGSSRPGGVGSWPPRLSL